MKDITGSLSDEDIDQIARLIDRLDHSSFEFLQLDVGSLKLTVGKGTAPLVQPATGPAILVPQAQAVPAQSTRAPVRAAASPPATVQASPPGVPAPASAAPAAKSVADGTVAITAPLMGMFYSKPDPAAPPFVTVGASVSKGSTLCLVEVMKVFNSVPSHLDGVITEVCARDAEMVDIGQVLFRVRPAAT